MVEFNLLKTVRQHLLNQDEKLPVYLSTTSSMTYPCCVLELLESWTNLALPSDSVRTQVKLSVTYYDTDLGIQQTLAVAGKIAQGFAGQVIAIDESHIAVFKPDGQNVVISSEDTKKYFKHIYTCIIREVKP